MGKSQRDKGSRVERKIVAMHRDIGIHAERVPLSGAAGGSYCGDVKIFPNVELKPSVDNATRTASIDVIRNIEYVAEVKARHSASGFKTVRDWLHGNDLLFLVEDRKEPIVAMPWQMYVRFLLQSDPSPDPSPDPTPYPSPDNSPASTPDPTPDSSPEP